MQVICIRNINNTFFQAKHASSSSTILLLTTQGSFIVTCSSKSNSLYKENIYLTYIINPFHATGLFRNPLKTSENLRFFYFFRGYWKRPVAWNGLRWLHEGEILWKRGHYRSNCPQTFYSMVDLKLSKKLFKNIRGGICFR